jgi:electron transfer flavoprotein alpha subunit
VVQCGADGTLLAGSRELLGEAAVLATQLGGEVVAVVLGPCAASLPESCAAHGADAVLQIEHPGLVEYSNEVQGAALCSAISDRAPFAVLFCATERGRDLAPRVAARLQAGLVGDAIGLSLDARGHFLMLKPAFSGAIVAPILSRTMPQLVTVRPGVLALRAADSSRRPRIERWTPTALPQSRTQLLRKETTLDEQAARLLSARMVVGVGMGIGDPRHIPTLHALAESFQGALCATRRVTDKGWMPRQLQVGLTGKVIAPQVYLAIGIRGVPYHAIGIQRAGTILAINQDAKAQIFKYARYGVVADWSQIVPAMLNELGH